jgi:serine/threonine protein kinase
MLKASVVNFPNTQKGLISNESKDFIRDCLAYHVEQRIDIRAALSHKMFDKK